MAGLIIISDDGQSEIWFGSRQVFGTFKIELAKLLGLESYKTGIYGNSFKIDGETRYTRAQAVVDVEALGTGAVAFFLHHDFGRWSSSECRAIVDFFKDLVVPEYLEESDVCTYWEFRKDFDTMMTGLKYCRDNNLEAVFGTP